MKNTQADPGVQQTHTPVPPTSIFQSRHCTFVTDRHGIRDVFPLLLYQTRASHYARLTLLYYTDKTSQPLFQTELESLESQFPDKLHIVYHTPIDPVQIEKPAELLMQEKLEAIINNNVCEEMQFLLWGADELIEVIYERLVFLGISKKIIHIQLTF